MNLMELLAGAGPQFECIICGGEYSKNVGNGIKALGERVVKAYKNGICPSCASIGELYHLPEPKSKMDRAIHAACRYTAYLASLENAVGICYKAVTGASESADRIHKALADMIGRFESIHSEAIALVPRGLSISALVHSPQSSDLVHVYKAVEIREMSKAIPDKEITREMVLDEWEKIDKKRQSPIADILAQIMQEPDGEDTTAKENDQ